DAQLVAAVAGAQVAVVALLDAELDRTVAAARIHAVAAARVALDLVAVVALLDAGLHDTVAAGRRHARARATVGLDRVAIVAALAALDGAVAALRGEHELVGAEIVLRTTDTVAVERPRDAFRVGGRAGRAGVDRHARTGDVEVGRRDVLRVRRDRAGA